MDAEQFALNPIGSAVGWLQGAFLGSIAITAAVVAVASVGFLMLTGRIDVRRAVQVVFGCFILFGASSIGQGIMAGANGFAGQQVSTEALAYPAPPPASYHDRHCNGTLQDTVFFASGATGAGQ